MRHVVIFVVVIVASALIGGAASSTSIDVHANRKIGALFVGDTDRHTCTAESVHSRSGDLVLTAAHCLTGATGPITYVPAYRAALAPFGRWTVTSIYLDAGWLTGQDVNRDYAVLRVRADPRTAHRTLESVTGRGFVIGSFGTGKSIRVVGYGAGSGDTPIGCRGRTREARDSPTVTCRGLVDGTSGSPWMTGRTTTIGLVGGYNQGGCVSFISHSPVFDADLTALIARADDGGPGDTAPPTGATVC